MTYKSSKILKTAFDRLKRLDGLSMRSWSKMTKINSATLNQIINSKLLCPSKMLNTIAASLSFDQLQITQFTEAYAIDLLKDHGIEWTVLSRIATLGVAPPIDVDYEDLTILKSWLHLAVMEMTTIKDFKFDVTWMAQKLFVSSGEVKQVVQDLMTSGHLVHVDGTLQKVHKKMRVPSVRSRKIVRQFHSQMLKRAIWEIEKPQKPDDFEKRRITGYTVTADSKKIKKFQERIESMMIQLAEEMSAEKGDSVYQLQIQLFPLTK